MEIKSSPLPHEIEIKPLNTSVPVDMVMDAPASKSYTNRALIITALADGISYIENALLSDDTLLMIKALEQIGIMTHLDRNNITVMGRAGRIGLTRNRIFAGNAGTTLRFLTGLLTLGHGLYTLDGDRRMRERPIDDLVVSLQGLGLDIRYELQKGFPPIILNANGLPGGSIHIRGSQSSQFVSSLLMAAPYAEKDIEIKTDGTFVSRPYIDMTISLMNYFGVTVDEKQHSSFCVRAPSHYQPRHYRVEADASNASYFFAAAAVSGGRVRVNNISYDTHQGDIHFVDLLEKMGSKVYRGSHWIEVQGEKLIGIEADLGQMPDVAQTLGVVALFAKGKTVIRNIAHLKLKETDRLSALSTELKKCGGIVETGSDYLTIESNNLHGNKIDTYDDHRMAMSFALVGLKVPQIVILNPGCVSKSFPDFWDVFQKLYR